MTHRCKVCDADISRRDVSAVFCFKCAADRSKLTGGRAAHAAVAQAVKKGGIPNAKTLACVDCNKPAFDYDHRDYSKPLDVVPVCRSCNLSRGPAKSANKSKQATQVAQGV